MSRDEDKPNNIDPETIRLFLVLGLLTLALVLGLRWTLFAPASADFPGLQQQIQAKKP